MSCNCSTEMNSRVEVLPYYQEATFTPQWFDENNPKPSGFHKIPAFELTNQIGETVSEKSLNGKVVVVDFFFTSCPGICPKMTANMTLVQEEFLEDDDILILSHSVTPEYDSAAVLMEYANRNGVNSDRWQLLTGPREEIYDLGRNQYFVEEDLGLEKNPTDFIHTENFVLIDQERHIRGIYNGLNKTAIAQLIADIKTLKNEL